MSSNDTSTVRAARLLGRAGAILLLLGLLTGGYVSAAMTGQISADPHAALAAHLNALLGSFWIFAVAWSLPYLRFGAVGLQRLAWLVIVPNYANWFVTGVKAYLKVVGVNATGEPKNDAIFGVLTVSVVVPSLVAASAWVYGFFGPRAAAEAPSSAPVTTEPARQREAA